MISYKKRATAPATKPAPATPALIEAAADLGVAEGAAEELAGAMEEAAEVVRAALEQRNLVRDVWQRIQLRATQYLVVMDGAEVVAGALLTGIELATVPLALEEPETEPLPA